MKWSDKQQAIFNFVQSGKGSAVVIAVAGSGKTTTIVEAAKLVPATLATCFVAFNKSIAEELKARLPQHVRSMTLNAMGFSAWVRHTVGRINVDANKTRDIIRRILSDEQQAMYGNGLAKLTGLAKSIGLVPAGHASNISPLTYDSDAAWIELIEKYDVDFHEDAQLPVALELARLVLRRSIEDAKNTIDFDDQLYMPVISGARFFANDYLFVDEAQDVNMVQRAMLKRALKPGGRLIAVGDPCQAIYGFRGADTSAIASIKREFNAIELPLTVSYRCPKAIVAHARQYVSHIEAHDSAPEGSITSHEKWGAALFTAADAILCRNTGPLIETAFYLMRNKVGCRVLGRELGVGLTALIRKMKAKTIDNLLTRLAAHQDRETARFLAKGQEEKADALADRIDTIRVFVNELSETRRTIPALEALIAELFTDQGKGLLTLCTVHKSKGLEWARVFILDRELMPSKWARQAWQAEQENNLIYVAVTRAKSELHFIDRKHAETKGGSNA